MHFQDLSFEKFTEQLKEQLETFKYYQIKPEWSSTKEWTKIKAGNLVKQNINLINDNKQLIAGTALEALSGSLLGWVRKNYPSSEVF
ncbi:MAG: hypothetical protein ACJAW3_001031 [Lentimonas sp.]